MSSMIGSLLVFIGTYTMDGSKGVYVYRFDPGTGQLVFTGHTADEKNPSFVVPSVDGRTLYAVSETGQYRGLNTGAVSAWRLDPETGALTFLNRQSSGGSAPCHLSVTADGAYVGAACYGSGNVCLLSTNKDGSLEPSDIVKHEGNGPTPRQKGPHAHSITPDPKTGKLYAADLGIDKVLVYDIVAGKLEVDDAFTLALPAGSGPRHVDFHENGRWLYVINELSNTVAFFSRPDAASPFELVEVVPTLPADFTGQSTCADIHIHPNGELLFGSNRGHDSIVAYRIDPETGKLSLIGHTPSGGEQPRNFAIDPTGRFLYAAHQKTGNVVGFTLDPETGKLAPLGLDLKIPTPVCVKFLDPAKVGK
jgi:6-phosphogluconolactonase